MARLEEEYSWQYPITRSRKLRKTIHHRAKFHLFKKNYKSACEKYIQWGEREYDTEYVLSLGENNICKKCLKKYKELKQ